MCFNASMIVSIINSEFIFISTIKSFRLIANNHIIAFILAKWQKIIRNYQDQIFIVDKLYFYIT